MSFLIGTLIAIGIKFSVKEMKNKQKCEIANLLTLLTRIRVHLFVRSVYNQYRDKHIE